MLTPKIVFYSYIYIVIRLSSPCPGRSTLYHASTVLARVTFAIAEATIGEANDKKRTDLPEGSSVERIWCYAGVRLGFRG